MFGFLCSAQSPCWDWFLFFYETIRPISLKSSECIPLPVTGAGNYELLHGGRVVVFLLCVAILIKKEMAEEDERWWSSSLRLSFHLWKRNVADAKRARTETPVSLAHCTSPRPTQSLVLRGHLVNNCWLTIRKRREDRNILGLPTRQQEP